MQEAMARIQPLCIDYRQYLIQQQKSSYDLVYFDPMFERPILQSSGYCAPSPSGRLQSADAGEFGAGAGKLLAAELS